MYNRGNNVQQVLALFAGIVAGIAVVFIAAVLSGTIIWLLWPIAVPAFFPGLVASGTIAGAVGWWEAVIFSWLIGLFAGMAKSNVTVNRS